MSPLLLSRPLSPSRRSSHIAGTVPHNLDFPVDHIVDAGGGDDDDIVDGGGGDDDIVDCGDPGDTCPSSIAASEIWSTMVNPRGANQDAAY